LTSGLGATLVPFLLTLRRLSRSFTPQPLGTQNDGYFARPPASSRSPSFGEITSHLRCCAKPPSQNDARAMTIHWTTDLFAGLLNLAPLAGRATAFRTCFHSTGLSACVPCKIISISRVNNRGCLAFSTRPSSSYINYPSSARVSSYPTNP